MTKRILNVGCGFDMYGTDRIDFKKTPATTKVCDIENGFPYKDETFEEIRAVFVFEHFRNLGFFIDECYRVLKKGGKIEIITDHAGFIVFHSTMEHTKYLDTRTGYQRHEDDFHYALFVPSHLKSYLRQFSEVKAGFSDPPGRVWYKRIILKLLPFNMGKERVWAIGIK